MIVLRWNTSERLEPSRFLHRFKRKNEFKSSAPEVGKILLEKNLTS